MRASARLGSRVFACLTTLFALPAVCLAFLPGSLRDLLVNAGGQSWPLSRLVLDRGGWLAAWVGVLVYASFRLPRWIDDDVKRLKCAVALLLAVVAGDVIVAIAVVVPIARAIAHFSAG